MQLRGQAAGGVDQHHVLAARFASGHGVEAHGGGVAPVLADDVYRVSEPLRAHFRSRGPDVQLLTRGCAKGVGSGQQHSRTVAGQMAGEFANGRGFACAVDACDHDNCGFIQSNL